MILGTTGDLQGHRAVASSTLTPEAGRGLSLPSEILGALGGGAVPPCDSAGWVAWRAQVSRPQHLPALLHHPGLHLTAWETQSTPGILQLQDRAEPKQ